MPRWRLAMGCRRENPGDFDSLSIPVDCRDTVPHPSAYRFDTNRIKQRFLLPKLANVFDGLVGCAEAARESFCESRKPLQAVRQELPLHGHKELC